MKQAGNAQQGKKPSDQGPVNLQHPQDVFELTDQDVQQVQGGLEGTRNEIAVEGLLSRLPQRSL